MKTQPMEIQISWYYFVDSFGKGRGSRHLCVTRSKKVAETKLAHANGYLKLSTSTLMRSVAGSRGLEMRLVGGTSPDDKIVRLFCLTLLLFPFFCYISHGSSHVHFNIPDPTYFLNRQRIMSFSFITKMLLSNQHSSFPILEIFFKQNVF